MKYVYLIFTIGALLSCNKPTDQDGKKAADSVGEATQAISLIRLMIAEQDTRVLHDYGNELQRIALTDSEKDVVAASAMPDLLVLLNRKESIGKLQVIRFAGALGKRSVILIPALKNLQKEEEFKRADPQWSPGSKDFYDIIAPVINAINEE